MTPPPSAPPPIPWAAAPEAAPAAPPEAGLPSAELLAAVLDQLDIGVVLVDGSGVVLLASDAARTELEQGGVLRIDEAGLLGVAGTTGQAALRAAVQAAVSDRMHQLLPLHTAAGRLTVAVQPLRVAGLAPLALVLLQRRQLCPSLVVEMLAGQHALTLAERRLLAGLLDGRRIADVAAAHGVQLSTVRSQAAALRAKFGVRRLEDLTRLAAEMPPMARPLQGLATGRAADPRPGARPPARGRSAR